MLLSLGVMMFSVVCATLVGAASGATSVTSRSGGGARWGFLIAIAVGVAAFVIGGLFIALRSRREYLAMEAQKASRSPDGES
ncbi:MAG: hypothetical protein ACR2JW_18695 [Thermomicrobiales bacterium]